MDTYSVSIQNKPSHFETDLHARDGLRLYLQGSEPAGKIECVICLVHGLGEHSGRYDHVAKFFNQAGLAVILFDLRGHGKSQGRRGHSPSIGALMEDIDVFIDAAAGRYPNLPIFLYGHSLGGLLALNFVLRRKPDLSGIITTGAGLRTSLTEQAAKLAMVNILGRIFPMMPISTGLDARLISRDPCVIESYRNDPLVHDRTTLGMAKSSLDSIPWVMEHARELNVPILMMNGTADQLTFPKGSEEFSQCVFCDCTMKLWPGLYHEIHNEPEKEQVLRFVVEWVKNRL